MARFTIAIIHFESEFDGVKSKVDLLLNHYNLNSYLVWSYLSHFKLDFGYAKSIAVVYSVNLI